MSNRINDTDINEISFEQAMAKLEEIVTALENGKAPLDRSLALFEEGVALVKLCSSKLEGAEKKVKILMSDKNGEYDERDFTSTEG